MNKFVRFSACCTLAMLALRADAGTRLKDLARLQGLQSTKLLGYGLVVGLDATGDTQRSLMAQQMVMNMVKRFGIALPDDQIALRNVAAVMLTTELPPFLSTGAAIDVTVSSMGDASSLEGGMLIMTPLVDGAGKPYATAQGPLSIGGFNIESGGGDRIRKNYTLVGRVPNGATLIAPSPVNLPADRILTWQLYSPDFTTVTRLAKVINAKLGNSAAIARNAANIEVRLPSSAPADEVVSVISELELLEAEPDEIARVIVNERTGTVVVGENVSLLPVAIAHGNLSIEIKTTPAISQPEPFSKGETVVVPETETRVVDERARLVMIEKSANVRDVAKALNVLGVSPRDVVAIFQALKQAGALKAELIIM
jgi:flagellar P-ring protein precursor FlgI